MISLLRSESQLFGDRLGDGVAIIVQPRLCRMEPSTTRRQAMNPQKIEQALVRSVIPSVDEVPLIGSVGA
ncbi:hypothetical protein AXK59_08050 [Tsukamurella tyrosinosolvens]|nr:hypothetical protein AXK59_08050 [Tsukamurella tyrosinosolvens]KZL95313.1 hypothetical protein AXX05_19075 [Tsukamurella tyrosinosolvens]